jgi:hypothetical protein
MLRTLTIALAATLFPVAAYAQTQPPAQGADTDGDGADEDRVDPGTANSAPNDGDVPAPTSDDDPTPEVASPASGGLVEQAGIGGNTGYGRAGVLELGGSAGFSVGSDFTNINVSPSIGWFVADNFQISAIFGFDYSRIDLTVNGMDETADGTRFSALVEPSYHLPFTRSIFGFLGLGIGGSYVTDLGGGFATAPRIGANFLVGRSGLLSPSLSWQYTTHELDSNVDQQTTAAVSSALRMNIGYTVMW